MRDLARRVVMVWVAASLLCGVPIEARADDTPEAHPCLGVWQGMGRNGGGLPWAIEMTVSSTSASCGGIEYDSPELDCGGPFTRCALEAASGRAVETYSHSVGCTPPGRVTFRCEGDVMEWDWVYDGPERVHTRLRRVRRSTPPSSREPSNDGPAPSQATNEGTPPTVGDQPSPRATDDERPRETPLEEADAPASTTATAGCGACTVTGSRRADGTVALLFVVVSAMLTGWRGFRLRRHGGR